MDEYDVAVIGGGPGGYVAAIRAAQLGLKTALVERDEVGGICLNWGCIPTKAIIRNAEVVNLFRRAPDFGVKVSDFEFDLAPAIDRSRRVVERLVKGVRSLLRKHGVELIQDEAYLSSATVVEGRRSGRRLAAKSVILATGARPRAIPSLPLDGERVITSREALELRELPPSIAIVGGGAVGVEFAYVYRAYGSQVTLLEMMDHLLPAEDQEISQLLERSFAKQGIQSHTGSTVQNLELGNGSVKVRWASAPGPREVECTKVLVAVGAVGNWEGLGLEKLGVAVEGGFIAIDQRMATNVPGLFAIGDVTGPPLLAHVASAQGIVAAEAIAGRQTPRLRYGDLPRATYCQPQVASLGLTEAEARSQGYEVKVGRFPFRANGKALALGEEEGLVKLVVDAKYGELLGAHLIGPEVTELLAELSLVKTLELTPWDLGRTVHAHPSLSEALVEAALDCSGEAIHI